MKNFCDHSHHTEEEVRILPYTDGGNLILCREHYDKEIVYRKERLKRGIHYELPKWDSLTVYESNPAGLGQK